MKTEKKVLYAIRRMARVGTLLVLSISSLLLTAVAPADAATSTIYPLCGDSIGDSNTGGTTSAGPRDVIAAAGDVLKLGWNVDCAKNYVDSLIPPKPALKDGIIVGANAITFDLNGFSIIGPTTPEESSFPGDRAGILLNGRTSVTVTNGLAAGTLCAPYVSTSAVTGFHAGVAIKNNAGNSSNVVEKLGIVGNIGLDGDYGDGVHIRNSDGNTIRHNNIVGNGPYSGITLWEESDSNVIQCNAVAGNTVTHQDIGIRLESNTTCTDSNVISGNLITGSTIDGISLLNGYCDATGNYFDNNLIDANGRDGIRLNGNPGVGASKLNHVHDNKVSGNGGAGIRATNSTTGNHIHGNIASGNNADTLDHRPTTDPYTGPPLDPRVRTVVNSPLFPPHGDIHDGNINLTGSCANTWYENTEVTEYSKDSPVTSQYSSREPGSPPHPLPGLFECVE